MSNVQLYSVEHIQLYKQESQCLIQVHMYKNYRVTI